MKLFLLLTLLLMLFPVKALEVSPSAKYWAEENPEIRVVADTQLPPFDFINDAGEHIGLGRNILDELEQVLPFQFTYLPFKNFNTHISQVKTAEAHLFSLCASSTAEKNGLLTSTPVFSKSSYLLIKDTGDITHIDDIQPRHVIGFGEGYATENEARLIGGTPKLKGMTSVEAGILALNREEINGFVVDAGQANYWISRHRLVDMKLIEIPAVVPLQLVFCISPDSPKLVEWINFGLNELGEERLSSLEQKWIGVDTKANIFKTHKTQQTILKLIVGTLSLCLILFILYILINKQNRTYSLAEKFGSVKFRNNYIAGLVFISIVMIIMTLFILKNSRSNTLHSYSESLDVSLMTTDRRLSDWFRERSLLISQAANFQHVKELTWVLNELNKANYPVVGSKELESFKASIEKNSIIGRLAKGYYIVNEDGRTIAGKYNRTLGKESVFYKQNFEKFNAIFQGKNVFIPPIYSDINLDNRSAAKNREPIISIGVPIYDIESQNVQAALFFTFDPNNDFSRLFISAQTGETGETYAINDAGVMISKSRLFRRLSNRNLIPIGESEILNVSMNKSNDLDLITAASNNTSGENLQGYLNYNKDTVIGKWFWHSQLGIMLIAEIRLEEVLQGYNQSRNILWFITLLSLSIISLVSIFMFVVGRRAHLIQVDSNRELERLVNERTQELAKSEQDNRLILGSVTDGIIGVDRDGFCIYINRSAKKMLKLDSEEFAGQKLSEILKIYDNNQQEILSSQLTHSFNSGNAFSDKSSHVLCKAKLNIAIEFSINPLIVDGHIVGVVLIIRDITNEEAIKEALVSAKQLAVEASNSKSNFLANMSHEIRTPMNAIIGMSYLALQDDISEKTRNYITKVNRSATNLLGIINDILDFSKIEAGKIEIENITFNLDEVLEDLTTVVLVKTEEKGLELLFHIDPNIPMELIGDPLRINQILTNLTSNSVKFTEQGHITISVTLEEERAEDIVLKFLVKDTGIGMSDKQINKLFQSFSQADASTTRKYGGTGLGLSISKSLVEKMGGQIWVESQPDHGSEFYFTICLQKSVNQETFIHKGGHTALDGKRVLLVDDSQSSIDVHKEIMESFGCQVYSATSGKQALDIVNKIDFEFDIALIDWKMSEMDGLETYLELQKVNNKGVKHAIMVSSHKAEIIKDEQILEHFDSFIAKPVTPSSLFNGLRKLLASETSQIIHRNKARQTKSIMDTLQGFHVLLVEDNDLNQELACELLEQAGLTVDLAENGLESIDKATNNHYDAILMDIQMPLMDGYEATEKLRSKGITTPIIAMTANAMASDKEKVIKMGMNDHISKPIDVKQLYTKLSRWITGKEAVQQPQILSKVNNDKTIMKPLNFTVIESKKGIEICNGNEGLYRRLLTRFITGQQNFQQEYNSARLAQDWEKATRLAHTLKGSAGNIGATSLYNQAQVLEHRSQLILDGADGKDIDSALNSVITSIAEVFADIENNALLTTSVSNTSKEADNEVLSFEDLKSKFLNLAELVENFDANAQDVAISIEKGVIDSPMKKSFKTLIDALQEYDFEAAEALLQEIEDQINTLVEKGEK